MSYQGTTSNNDHPRQAGLINAWLCIDAILSIANIANFFHFISKLSIMTTVKYVNPDISKGFSK